MKFWGKIRIGEKLIKDAVVESQDFKGAVNLICDKFDLSKPIILEKHMNEIKNFNITVFQSDDFVESVKFDSFEIEKIVTKKKT